MRVPSRAGFVPDGACRVRYEASRFVEIRPHLGPQQAPEQERGEGGHEDRLDQELNDWLAVYRRSPSEMAERIRTLYRELCA